MAKRRLNGILLVYSHDLNPIASNMLEHVHAFRTYSSFPVWEVNAHLGMPEGLREFDFAAIVLHYSLFGWLPFSLPEEFRAYLAAATSSYKVAFFQDEYRWWQKRAEVLNHLHVDCVYTCLEPAYFPQTYGRFTNVPRIETTLPGYVTDDMVSRAERFARPDAEREIDVGYRGRQAYGYMGKGAHEKHEIGARFREEAAGEGLALDIETAEHERIYGNDWLRFLGNCRAVLGVEAGTSIFDVDDEIIPRYEALRASCPDLPYEEVYRRVLEPHDGTGIKYRTVSPRVFEAAATRSCQILFEGRYSGVLRPMAHYIPLRKDFTNLPEVLRLFRDDGLRRELTDNCHRDLIASGTYGYRSFVAEFDAGLVAAGVVPAPAGDGGTDVTDLVLRGESSRLLRHAEAQQAQYQELMNAYAALQAQVREQQGQLAASLRRHPWLEARHLLGQGARFVKRMVTGDWRGARTLIGNELRAHPRAYGLAKATEEHLRALRREPRRGKTGEFRR